MIKMDNDPNPLPEGSNSIPNYYPMNIFPKLSVLKENIGIICEELETVPKWTQWPEDLFDLRYTTNTEWTVFPFLHTFPCYDESKMTWIASTCSHCPRTAALLRQVPNIRTALFSKLGPNTSLSSHTGWADLANGVLRCHICLKIPSGEQCGLNVCREICMHKEGEVIVFDDSKLHKAFNLSDEPRYILIVDILRPEGIPKGIAKGGHTMQLDNFIEYFK
jgi:aspartyl/asparaginyl beta-hydroxylase (cupin superfamily)